ncbi:MAG: hypothetical protein HRU12_06910, partial [Phaeodactylibacter sp.]|nr:hypothetical protein [Phaeodactylibacter sp.]
MKPALTLSAIIALLTTTLLAFNPDLLKFQSTDNKVHEKFTSNNENAALSMPNNLVLDIGLLVNDENPETGVAFSYTISYATQSLVEDADNPVIDVPLPNGMQVLGFVGNTDVAGTEMIEVMGVPTFRINMVDPLEAGAAGILTLQLSIPPGQVCDGTVISAVVTFSADDADNSPVSDQTMLTVGAPNSDWNVNVNEVTTGVPGATSLFQVGISPSGNTGFLALGNATLTAEVPNDVNVINCSGCMQSGNELTWDVSNASGATSFPVVLEFPAPPYDFSDNFTVSAELDGTTIDECPVDINDTDSFNGTLPAPNPAIACGASMSSFEIGEEGVYLANADVTGNVAVDNFTATISIPEQIEVSSIAPSVYLFAGIPVSVSYSTNLSGSASLGNFNTTLDGSTGGFAPPALGAGEYLTELVFEFGTVPPGFGPVGG